MRWRNDEGSASTAIGVMIFLPILALAMGAMRIVQMNGDVSSAARFSARAATLTYREGAAENEAEEVAAQALEDRGISCNNFSAQIIDVDPASVGGIIPPGATITVEVSCSVDLSQSLIAGFPGEREITVQAVGKVDNIRGGGELVDP